MKRFLMAVAITGIVSVTTLAGHIPTGDFVQPPPPPPLLTTVVLTVLGLI